MNIKDFKNNKQDRRCHSKFNKHQWTKFLVKTQPLIFVVFSNFLIKSSL